MLSGERGKARARPPRCRKRSEESRGWRAANLIFSTNLASRHIFLDIFLERGPAEQTLDEGYCPVSAGIASEPEHMPPITNHGFSLPRQRLRHLRVMYFSMASCSSLDRLYSLLVGSGAPGRRSVALAYGL